MLVIDTRIIEGLPADVNGQVRYLVQNGWQLNGEMFHRSVDGNNIAVQGMYLPKDEESNKEPTEVLYDYHIDCNNTIDTKMVSGAVSGSLVSAKQGWFRYHVKLTATGVENGRSNIQQMLDLYDFHDMEPTITYLGNNL